MLSVIVNEETMTLLFEWAEPDGGSQSVKMDTRLTPMSFITEDDKRKEYLQATFEEALARFGLEFMSQQNGARIAQEQADASDGHTHEGVHDHEDEDESDGHTHEGVRDGDPMTRQGESTTEGEGEGEAEGEGETE